MRTIEVNTRIKACSIDELQSDDRELVTKAIEATRNSYSPYSHFSVGACLRMSNGEMVIGANQENAAYPVGLCAERTAIFAAQAQHPELAVTCIAIAARDTSGELTRKPISPCGSCRQVMVEIEQRYGIDMKVFLYGEDTVLCIDTAKDLLPLSFIADDMSPDGE